MPKVEVKQEDSDDAEDRRMLAEIREMSLREAGVRGSGSYERGHRHRPREGSRETMDRDTRQRNRNQETRRQEAPLVSDIRGGVRSERSVDTRLQARQLEHQASLRSLLSDSGLDSSEMQAEILRQIQEEGLLDGVDLDNLDVSQEDELSERIAEAYRRRHNRGFSSRFNLQEPRGSSSGMPRTDTDRARQRQRPRHLTEQGLHSSRLPVSMPYLSEAYPTGHGHRHRTSSEYRRQVSPATAAALAASETQSQAARSAIELSDRPRTRTNVRDRPTEHPRRTTDPERLHLADTGRGRAQATRITYSGATSEGARTTSPVVENNPIQATATPIPHVRGAVRRPPNPTNPHSLPDEHQAPYPFDERNRQQTVSSPTTSTIQPTLYVERLLSCNGCGKASIQYDLHFHCSLCSNGDYDVCLRCYRGGKGCLHWFGFGRATMQLYERRNHSPLDMPPHRLVGRRFLHPPPQSQQSPTAPQSRMTTSSDPSTRLQSGFFCSTCSAFANDCFWQCDCCNEGEWGFCNPCVNQGKCCTHPLLPIAHPSLHLESKGVQPTSGGHSFTALPSQALEPQSDGLARAGFPEYTPLSFSTCCDICTYPIPPSTTRFHCPQCNDGDYDICASCYQKLMTSGRISPENGTIGWRKCPQSHRMVIIGFEDGPTGQRRVVVHDRVGGHAARNNSHTAEAFANLPKDMGLKATALWAYWPNEGVEDELGFPKWAEITEARDINGDWWEGRYCGRGGLWPGEYARVLR